MPRNPDAKGPFEVYPGVKVTEFPDGGVRVHVHPVDGMVPTVKVDNSKEYHDHVIVDRPKRR